MRKSTLFSHRIYAMAQIEKRSKKLGFVPWHKLEKSKKLEFSNLCHGINPSFLDFLIYAMPWHKSEFFRFFSIYAMDKSDAKKGTFSGMFLFYRAVFTVVI
jgi:hypothetical protein